MENEVKIDLILINRLGPRCKRMVSWIMMNQNRIEGYRDGNVNFSFTSSTLKVKDENYENI